MKRRQLVRATFLVGGLLLILVAVPAEQTGRVWRQARLDLELLRAVQAGRVDHVRLLLNRGANPKTRLLNGFTPLREAKKAVEENAMQYLLESHPVGEAPSQEKRERQRLTAEQWRARHDIYEHLQQFRGNE